MANFRVNVNVDPNGNVKVTRSPKRRVYVKDKDSVTFTSNRKGTAIKFTQSPFAEFRRGSVIKDLRPPKGPFIIRGKKGHIDCGLVIKGKFKQWAAAGDNIPPC